MLRALVSVLCALIVAGCGGGDGGSDETSSTVAAFPDVLEIARSELPENAPLLAVSVRPSVIAFLHVEFGRSTEIRYDAEGIFVGNRRSTKPVDPRKTFSIEIVPADAPERILSAIREQAEGEVAGFEATLEQPSPGTFAWRATATVDGAPKKYRAALDGTLAG